MQMPSREVVASIHCQVDTTDADLFSGYGSSLHISGGQALEASQAPLQRTVDVRYQLRFRRGSNKQLAQHRQVKVNSHQMPAGRPSKYRDAIANEILERISHGEPLTKICRDSHMPAVSTVFYWEQKIEGFSEKVTRERELSADNFSNE